MEKTYNVDENGYYGEFGGAYVPEILYATVEQLRSSYREIIATEEFKTEFRSLL